MPGEGFITLHEAQPQRAPSTPAGSRPHHPPPGPVPGYTGQPAPRVVNVNLHQASGQQYHASAVATPAPQQQQYAPQAAPFPVQPNTHVKISDIRKERPPTAEEAREAVSSYSVVRITRADEDGGYNEDGSRRKPSWKRAVVVEDPGITKREAARTVRELNRDTISAARKKATLSDDEQRQIELALEDRQKKFDDAWFQTTLVQLDAKEKETKEKKDPGREREKEKDRRKERLRKEYGLFGVTRVPAKPSPKSKDTKKVVAERVSLTAYFKRAPRPEVDPIAILQYREAQRNAQAQAYAQQATRPENSGQYPPPPPPLNVPTSRVPNFGGPSLAGHHGQAYNRGPGVTIIQPAPQRQGPGGAVRGHPRRPSPRIHHRAGTPPSADESVYSETFSGLGDDDTSCTSPSTVSYVSSRDSHEHPRSPRAVFREGPAHYGIHPGFNRGGANPQTQGPVHIQPHRANERDRRFNVRHPVSPPQNPFPPQPPQTPGAFFHANPNAPTVHLPASPSPPAAASHNHTQIPGHIPSPTIQIPGQVPPPAAQVPRNIPPPPPAGVQIHGQHIPPPPPMSIPAAAPTTIPAAPLDPRQIYDNAYAAGRADTREEAIAMAERITAAASANPKTRDASPVPVRFIPRGYSSDQDRGRDRLRAHSRGGSRSRSRSRSRSSSSVGRDHSQDRDRGRGRGRSRSVGPARSRERRRPVRRNRSLEDGRSRSFDRNRDRASARTSRGRGRSRSWSRERTRPPSPRPRSGVRLVRPADWYIRPRVGMDREGLLGRGMERLRLSTDVGEEPLYELGRERARGGQYREQRSRERGRDRDRELLAERLLREEEQMRREERLRLDDEERERERRARDWDRDRDDPLGRRRRDSGVDVGSPTFADSNPFRPRPGLARRNGLSPWPSG